MATPLEKAKEVLAHAKNNDVLVQHGRDGKLIIEVRHRQLSRPLIKNKWVNIAEKMGERDFFQGKGDDILKETQAIRDDFSLRGPISS